MSNKLFKLLLAAYFFSLTNFALPQFFIDSGQNLGNGTIFSIVLGDLDGDNDSDAIVVDYLSYTKIWFNDGQGIFTYSGQSIGVPNEKGHDAAIGDLDGDGDNDIFLVNNEGPNKIFFNDGSGIFTDSGQQLGSFAYLSVILIDVDGDNDLDALLANFLYPGELWLNNGNGVFTNSGQNIGNDAANHMGVADLDGDNDPDIFLNNIDAYDQIWFNDGIGSFTNSGQSIGSPQSWGNVALADLDNDGDIDAFVGNYGSGISKVWINDGQGTFSEQSSYSGNGAYVALKDLDNDGDIDAVTCAIDKFIKIWLNDRTGNFLYSGSLGYNGLSVFLADVDNDNDNDVAVGYLDGYGWNKIFINQTINGVEDESTGLPGFELIQNYPNPFNPSTTIIYQIPELSFVAIKVYDVLGKEIATLVNEEKPAGIYKVDFNAKNLSSGIYFYKLFAKLIITTKKMTLVK